MKERINIQKSDNTFIYVIKKGSSYYTLGQYEYRRDYKIGLNKRYIGILKANLNDCPQMVNKANNLEFDDKQVIKFITQYNLCVNPESTSKQLTYKVKKIIRPGIEASISKIVLFPETRKERGFSTGFFMDIHKPDISTKFFSSLGLNYRYLSVEVIDPDYDDRFSNTPTYVKESIQMIRLPILLNYGFKRIPNPKPVPFVSFGFTPMFVFGQDLETIGGGFVFNFGGGFYTNNLKFFLMLEHAGIPFVKDMNLKILNAGLGFTFNKK